MKMMKIFPRALVAMIAVALGACTNDEGNEQSANLTAPQSEDIFLRADPPAGAELADAPSGIRILLTQTPDVQRSDVQLFGPTGEVAMSGFHTMGANDLMIFVNDDMPDGAYRVEWHAVVGDDGTEHRGSYEFSVSADAAGPPVTEDGLPLDSETAFLKADPPVDAVLTRSPRTLRVYLSQLPNIERSSLTLNGPNGEVALSRFHTMGADDLMIEVDEQPLPDGEYTVAWMARFGDADRQYQGSYQFTVALPEAK